MSGYKFGDLLVELLKAEREGTASPSQITTLQNNLNILWDDYNLFRTWLQPGQSKISGTSINFPINLIYSTGVLAVNTASIAIQIPQLYNHLLILENCRNTNASANMTALTAIINGDTAAHYGYQQILGSGASVVAGAATLAYLEIGAILGDNAPAGESCSSISFIPNYRSTTLYKNILILHTRSAIASTDLEIEGASWASTNPITDMLIASDLGNIKAGSSISIYGLV
jgi:hypothetical protein